MGRIESLVAAAIDEGVFPGAAWAFGRVDSPLATQGSLGHYTYSKASPRTEVETLFDLASVSKVVGTTTAAMILYDRALLHLDQPVSAVLPEFAQSGKAQLTLRNLLTHDSGLIAFRPYQMSCTDREQVWDAICNEPLSYPTGTKMVYSDLNMIALQMVIERLSGMALQEFLAREVWTRLGMSATTYNPGLGNSHCAPTEGVEPWRMRLRKLRYGYLATESLNQIRVDGPSDPDAAQWIQGEVHDPNAMVFGGVAGHAGLFSNIQDLVRFANFMLREGENIVRGETVRLFTSKQSELSTRALGWDTKSPEGSSAGARFGSKSFGHTGYTGTSIWIDPEARTYAVLLTNRVHPTSENTKIIQFRPVFHDAVAEELS
jgi:CubicO group peptidase (beta-lactamase class C family)